MMMSQAVPSVSNRYRCSWHCVTLMLAQVLLRFASASRIQLVLQLVSANRVNKGTSKDATPRMLP